ncbi:MAG TPA: hypothetical protein P5060_00795 [Candidatus Absconditabacterales bacterium]|nr:hypothetical protein [Candidatus Absconditabacterales bacterium]
MKKLFIFIFTLLSFVFVVQAGNISVNNLGSLNSQCNPQESVEVYYYYTGQNTTIVRSPYDKFGNTLDSLISVNSYVDLWRNNGIITDCNDWSRVSNVTVANDSNGSMALQNYDGCVFNLPSTPKYNDPNRIDAQIHFNIVYQKVWDGAPNTINSKFYHRDFGQNSWTCYPGGGVVSDYNACPNVDVEYGQNNDHGFECLNYKLFWCGDGIVNRPSGSTNYNNGTFSEQCDPADPSQQGWGNGGCSNTCQAINIVQAPTCEIEVSPTQNAYKLDWLITGSFDDATINFNPSTNIQPNYDVNYYMGTLANIVPPSPGLYTASMTVSNAGGSYTCTDTFLEEAEPQGICGDGQLDWPNGAGVYEECDNGPLFGNGCDMDCTLSEPSCTLQISPLVQLIGEDVIFNANTNPWATYYSLFLGDNLVSNQPLSNNINANSSNTVGSNTNTTTAQSNTESNIATKATAPVPLSFVPNIIYTGAINFPYTYTYSNTGFYTGILVVQNNYAGPVATGVSMPIATCEQSFQIVHGCEIFVNPSTIELGEVAEISWTIGDPGFATPSYMYISPSIAGSWPHNIYYTTGSVFVGPNIASTGQYDFELSSTTSYFVPFTCTGSLTVLEAPTQGDLQINKTLLTTGNMLPGDFVQYRIEVFNAGDGVFYDAYINDLMPASLDLISHEIVGLSTPYNSGQWQNVYGEWIFEYSGFDLQPGQSVFVNVTGQVITGASANETTNCAFTSGAFDCVVYNLAANPQIIKSQMMSNGVISTNFTTGNIAVNTGDYIVYRLDFGNYGGADTTGGVEIVDVMPICVDYVSASIHGVSNANFVQSQDINGIWTLEYNSFDLDAWQTGYVIITGQIMDTVVCNNYNTYVNNSYIYFHNPLEVRQSSVTAERSDKSIVDVTKSSNINNHLPGDDKLFVVEVQNFGPNPISNIELEDIWPAGNCINYVDWTGVGFTKDPLSLLWSNPNTLLPGDSLTLYISGSILDSQTCVNPNYTNIVNLRYEELGVEYTDQAQYNFAVSATPVADISLIKTADKSVVSSGDTIVYTIVYQNMGNTILDNYVITDYWPGMVDFVSATPFPNNIVNLSTGSVLTWNFNSQLLPGQTGQIILEGEVQ